VNPNTDPHKVEYERKGRNLATAIKYIFVATLTLVGCTIALMILIWSDK
jgi:hypothetical protein